MFQWSYFFLYVGLGFGVGLTPELEEPALVLDAITNFVDRS
jgi:hypothetical protein